MALTTGAVVLLVLFVFSITVLIFGFIVFFVTREGEDIPERWRVAFGVLLAVFVLLSILFGALAVWRATVPERVAVRPRV